MNRPLWTEHAQCSRGFGSGAKIPQENVTHVLGTVMLMWIRCTRTETAVLAVDENSFSWMC